MWRSYKITVFLNEVWYSGITGGSFHALSPGDGAPLSGRFLRAHGPAKRTPPMGARLPRKRRLSLQPLPHCSGRSFGLDSSIRLSLRSLLHCPVVSLADVIFSLSFSSCIAPTLLTLKGRLLVVQNHAAQRANCSGSSSIAAIPTANRPGTSPPAYHFSMPGLEC